MEESSLLTATPLETTTCSASTPSPANHRENKENVDIQKCRNNCFRATNVIIAPTQRFTVVYSILRIVLYVCTYYALSIMVSLYNKYTIGNGLYNFAFPLFITSFHTCFHFFFGSFTLWLLKDPDFPPRYESFDELKRNILPGAITTALDIGLSNIALKTVSLSFYTMVKSSAPLFVLLCAVLFKLERPSLSLLIIIFSIGFGVFLTVWKDDGGFDLWGIFLVGTASAMSGIRWSLLQLLIQGSKCNSESNRKKTPLRTMVLMAPFVSLCLFIAMLFIEGIPSIIHSSFFADFHSIVRSIGIMGLGAFTTFFMILSEYKVVSITSVLSLSISGIIKEILTIILSIIIFGDVLSKLNVIGLIISIAGIFLYNYSRYQTLKYHPDPDQNEEATENSFNRNNILYKGLNNNSLNY